MSKQYLLASDFDQTLSFNDSGIILSELLGATGYEQKIAGLAQIHLVQQGGELAYLLLHDPEYRRVRKEHLVEVGKRIRLKHNIRLLTQLLDDLDGRRFAFYVISAAPEEVIQSAQVSRHNGLTIAVSKNKFLTPIARRTVLSDDALSVLVPVLEEIGGWDSTRIRAWFESHGFVLREWDKMRTDALTLSHAVAVPTPAA